MNCKLMLVCLIMIAFLAACSTSKQNIDCSKYKRGVFMYYYKNTTSPTTVRVLRNDTMQSETLENTGTIANYKIRWVDSCTYQLKFINMVPEGPDSLRILRKQTTLTVNILAVTDQYYLFEATSDKSSFVLKDTIWTSK